MPSTCSFDVTTGVDLQEVDNAVNQAQKEIAQRYDFKGSPATIELDLVRGSVRPANQRVRRAFDEHMESGRLAKHKKEGRRVPAPRSDTAPYRYCDLMNPQVVGAAGVDGSHAS